MNFAIPAFIGGVGPWELLIILAVVLVVFGGRRIPQLAKDLGSGIREFRRSLSGTEENLRIEEEPTEKARAAKPRAKKTGKGS